jgi:hypothetical protein
VKVIINTFYRESHAGAVLQAYALSRAIKALGHEPEILAYDRPPRDGRQKTLKQKIMACVNREAETARQYAAFRSRFLRESGTIYHHHEEIVAHPPSADAFVCGSDQIWNPKLLAGHRFDPAYFLQFSPASVRRISYAASFGGFQPSAEEEALLRTYLSGFNAISVREPGAQTMLAKILGRPVALTLDPTLLPDNYAELLEPAADTGRYILLYSLQNSDEIRQAARAVAKYYGLPIWSAGGPLLPWKILGRRIETRSPLHWINLINGAAAVVTNSFHGLVFSLLLKKRVILSPLVGLAGARNDRMRHLCAILGVTPEVMPENVAEGIRKEIDWELMTRNLSEYRASSIEFLSFALKCKQE